MKRFLAVLLAGFIAIATLPVFADDTTPSEAVSSPPATNTPETPPLPASPGEATSTPRVKPRPTPTIPPEIEEVEEDILFDFTQEDITIPADGYTIPATVTMPIGSAGKTFPCVILCASYGQGRNEASNAYNTLAARLAQSGIATIRFDYKGVGDSDEDFSTFTFFTGIEEAMLCYEYMTAREDINPLAMGILGWGMGGGIALEAAGEYDMFDSIAVWSGTTYDGTLSSEEEQAYNRAQDDGIYEAPLDWGGTLRLAPQYFESMMAMDTQSALEKITTPTLMVEGDAEESRLARARELIEGMPDSNAKLEVLQNTDSTFGLEDNENTFEALCTLTTAWFMETL